MTSANNEPVRDEYERNEPASAFNSLPVSERLAALALIYKELASSISADALGTPASEISGLVRKVEEMPQDRQVDTLQDILTAGKNDQGEIVLDPNPSKALTELVTGGGDTIPTDQYSAMDAQSKLAFWYQVAQKLGSSLPGIPSDFSPSSEVKELLNSLKSLDDEQRMIFLKRVV